MRILLSWKKWDEDVSYLISGLEKGGHEVVYWIGLKKHKTADIKAVAHDTREARTGEPAEGVCWSDFPPVGEDLIEQLYEDESTILTIMSRMHGEMSVEERKHIYYSRLGYWYGVLKKYKPDVIIFDDVPHSIHNFVIYSLAKLLGIKTRMFQIIRIGDRFLLFSDWKNTGEKLKEEFDKIRDRDYKPSDLSLDVRGIYESHVEASSGDQKALYRNYSTEPERDIRRRIWELIFLLPNKVNGVINRIKYGTLFEGVMSNVFQVRDVGIGRDLRRECESVQSDPDLEVPFVYLALHFQPERSTSPQGGIFVDQMLMVETVAAALPAGWKLYVKEHPRQWEPKGKGTPLRSRYLGYYKDISKIKNVSMVPVHYSSVGLIRKSQAVATATGTVGFETLLQLKSPLVFGYPWYKNFPGVFKVDGVETCKAALLKIKNGYKPDKQEFINFLKAFDTIGVRGYYVDRPDALPLDHPEKLNKKEGMDSFIKALLSDI